MKLIWMKGRNCPGSRRICVTFAGWESRKTRSKPVHSLWTTCFLGEHHEQEGIKSKIKVKSVCPWGQRAPLASLDKIPTQPPRLPTKSAPPEQLQPYTKLLLCYCKSFITRQKKNSRFSEIPFYIQHQGFTGIPAVDMNIPALLAPLWQAASRQREHRNVAVPTTGMMRLMTMKNKCWTESFY